MSTYASELLEGFAEAHADYGTSVTIQESGVTIDAVAVGPQAVVEMGMATMQEAGTFNFECRRTDAASAGLTEKSQFIVGGGGMIYNVHPIEDDPGNPLLFVSATKAL